MFCPCSVKFSMTKSNIWSVYSILGMGTYPMLAIIAGRITRRMSFHRWGLNVRLPSPSNSRSLVNRFQSLEKREFKGSVPQAENHVDTASKMLSSWGLYFWSKKLCPLSMSSLARLLHCGERTKPGSRRV